MVVKDEFPGGHREQQNAAGNLFRLAKAAFERLRGGPVRQCEHGWLELFARFEVLCGGYKALDRRRRGGDRLGEAAAQKPGEQTGDHQRGEEGGQQAARVHRVTRTD